MPTSLVLDVCSPGDCFVSAIFVTHGQKVGLGDKLLQMDTEDEDRQLRRLATTAQVNDVSARKYSGAQLQTQLDLAQKAIDLAKTAFEDATEAAKGPAIQFTLGLASAADKFNAQLNADKANIQWQAAQTALAKLKLAAQNYQDSYNLIKAHLSAEQIAVTTQRSRKLIVAPLAGTISLRALQGSFVQLGDILLQIQA